MKDSVDNTSPASGIVASNYGAADASNTAVRAFLWKAGAEVWGSNFNVKSGKGVEIWRDIRYEVFGDSCAYCGVDGNDRELTIDHLDMINREQVGLHHPGNIAPCCRRCQTRKKVGSRRETWEDVLRRRCEETGTDSEFELRRDSIHRHMHDGKYAIPDFPEGTHTALRLICERLYRSTSREVNDSVDLYKSILDSFINV